MRTIPPGRPCRKGLKKQKSRCGKHSAAAIVITGEPLMNQGFLDIKRNRTVSINATVRLWKRTVAMIEFAKGGAFYFRGVQMSKGGALVYIIQFLIIAL